MKRHGLNEHEHAKAAVRLRACLLFARLSSGEFDTILNSTRCVQLKEGECLFEQLQPAQEIFLLESGQIKLALLSPEGHEKVIDLISPGTSFAEAVMFSGMQAYPVTATALADSQVWGIESRTYDGILRQSNDACFAVMAQMSRRLHWQIAELDRLTLHNAMFRVVSYLLDQVPSTHLGQSEIRLDTHKHVIASRLSITPETLSRTFARLSRDGYIEISENTIILNHLERLRRYLQGGSL